MSVTAPGAASLGRPRIGFRRACVTVHRDGPVPRAARGSLAAAARRITAAVRRATAEGLPLLATTAHADEGSGTPRNIIVLISDGGGYYHVDIASLYETGNTATLPTAA